MDIRVIDDSREDSDSAPAVTTLDLKEERNTLRPNAHNQHSFSQSGNTSPNSSGFIPPLPKVPPGGPKIDLEEVVLETRETKNEYYTIKEMKFLEWLHIKCGDNFFEEFETWYRSHQVLSPNEKKIVLEMWSTMLSDLPTFASFDSFFWQQWSAHDLVGNKIKSCASMEQSLRWLIRMMTLILSIFQVPENQRHNALINLAVHTSTWCTNPVTLSTFTTALQFGIASSFRCFSEQTFEVWTRAITQICTETLKLDTLILSGQIDIWRPKTESWKAFLTRLTPNSLALYDSQTRTLKAEIALQNAELKAVKPSWGAPKEGRYCWMLQTEEFQEILFSVATTAEFDEWGKALQGRIENCGLVKQTGLPQKRYKLRQNIDEPLMATLSSRLGPKTFRSGPKSAKKDSEPKLTPRSIKAQPDSQPDQREALPVGKAKDLLVGDGVSSSSKKRFAEQMESSILEAQAQSKQIESEQTFVDSLNASILEAQQLNSGTGKIDFKMTTISTPFSKLQLLQESLGSEKQKLKGFLDNIESGIVEAQGVSQGSTSKIKLSDSAGFWSERMEEMNISDTVESRFLDALSDDVDTNSPFERKKVEKLKLSSGSLTASSHSKIQYFSEEKLSPPSAGASPPGSPPPEPNIKRYHSKKKGLFSKAKSSDTPPNDSPSLNRRDSTSHTEIKKKDNDDLRKSDFQMLKDRSTKVEFALNPNPVDAKDKEIQILKDFLENIEASEKEARATPLIGGKYLDIRTDNLPNPCKPAIQFFEDGDKIELGDLNLKYQKGSQGGTPKSREASPRSPQHKPLRATSGETKPELAKSDESESTLRRPSSGKKGHLSRKKDS